MKIEIFFLVLGITIVASCTQPKIKETSLIWLKTELMEIKNQDIHYRSNKVLNFRQNDDSVDQHIRLQLALDEDNQKRVAFILENFGYPDKKDVGHDLAIVPCLVVHHAPPVFMEKHMGTIIQAVRDQKIGRALPLALVDRYHRYTTGMAIFDRGEPGVIVDSTINKDSVLNLFEASN